MDIGNLAVAVIGLGYVGLPLAVEFGKVRPVVGFDIDEARIAELKSGIDATLEVAPEALALATRLEYSSDASRLSECGIFIVTVPTPIDSANRPDLGPLIRASETVGRAMKDGAVVIYESTVFPGCTEETCVPVLERVSGLRFNQGFFCGYSPERINPGDKVNTLTTIRKITSGSTPEVAEAVDALYREIIKAGTWKASSLKVAEAAKVIENSQRDLNIAFVNVAQDEQTNNGTSAAAAAKTIVGAKTSSVWVSIPSRFWRLRAASGTSCRFAPGWWAVTASVSTPTTSLTRRRKSATIRK